MKNMPSYIFLLPSFLSRRLQQSESVNANVTDLVCVPLYRGDCLGLDSLIGLREWERCP